MPKLQLTFLTHLILLTSLSLLSPHASASGPSFLPAPAPPTVPRGSGPVLLADINHDGHLDLVTKHLTNRVVTLLLGDGRGHFVPNSTAPMKLDFDPAWIALAKVDNGKTAVLAIASKDDHSENVQTFLADRSGTFSRTPSSRFSVSDHDRGFKPTFHFADLNEDGNVDLISANGRRNAVRIYLGDGRGGFSAGPTIQLESGPNIHTLDVGDMDGDGHLDLVSTTAAGSPDGKPGRLSIRRGDGKGGFSDPGATVLSVPPDPMLGTLVDLNGDGRLDVVLLHGRSKTLTLLLNDGKGSFAPRPGVPLEVGMPAYVVMTADINRDHHADLIIGTVNDRSPSFESRIEVLFGDGHGGFAPAPGSPYPAAPGAYTLAYGDINEDGKPDILASSFESNTITILLAQ